MLLAQDSLSQLVTFPSLLSAVQVTCNAAFCGSHAGV